jgi:hypothetical protein
VRQQPDLAATGLGLRSSHIAEGLGAHTAASLMQLGAAEFAEHPFDGRQLEGAARARG